MDVNALTAMLQTILEQNQSAQLEARRHSEAAMSQMIQGQTTFLGNLAQVASWGQTKVESTMRGPLVDPRGGRVWRLKFWN